MKKKLLSILLTVVMVTAVFSGCSKKNVKDTPDDTKETTSSVRFAKMEPRWN